MSRILLDGERERTGTWEYITPKVRDVLVRGPVGVAITIHPADHDDPANGFDLTWWSSEDGLAWRMEGGSRWRGGPAWNRDGTPKLTHATGAVRGERLRKRMIRFRVVNHGNPLRVRLGLDTPDDVGSEGRGP